MDENKQSFLERPIIQSLPAISGEVFIFGLIILLTIVSRFYDLETRVMSHDESLHTYFSYLLYKGDGYQHTPMMHGPFQFHVLALSYFLFGVSDLTARIPSVLFSIATIWSLWYWRKYLGKVGVLIAAFMMLISPYLLYYGRYVRNETFSGFAGLLMLWAVLRYLDVGEKRYLYWLTLSMLINFTSKETAFIYAAQMLLFLAAIFIWHLVSKRWHDDNARNGFIIAISIMILLVGAALGAALLMKDSENAVPDPIMPANPLADTAASAGGGTNVLMGILIFLIVVAFAAALYQLVKGLGWRGIREERSFDLLMLVGTLVLPMLTPLLSALLGWVIPTTAGELMSLVTRDYIQIGVAIAAGFILSIALGLWWNPDLWWKNALLFYAIFTVLYTTVFTNSVGFITGIFGSLGYWIVQQEVQRGSQPWYYYLVIQIPVYEFLPAIGVWVGIWFGLKRKSAEGNQTQITDETEKENGVTEKPNNPIPVFALLLWWVISSIAAYTYAGERMPWLTYHLTIPMILLSAWGLNQLVEKMPWAALREKKAWLGASVLFIFFTSLVNAMDTAATTSPFLGKELAQLQSTMEFMLPMIVALASGIGVWMLFRDWSMKEALGLATLVIFGLLSLWTWRAAYRAAYINYDSAKEYLVYAHAATGVKDVIGELEEISMRTTGDMSALIAYDASAPDTGISWPFVWYLRDFTNLRSFDAPTRSLRDAVAIVVDSKNFDKIEPVVGQGYYRSDYIRMWWPNQDYYGLTYARQPENPFPADYPCTGIFSLFRLDKNTDYSRICNVFTNPAMRSAVIDIWSDRDYSQYAQVTGKSTLTDITWDPSDEMRLYVRKDVAAQVWDYGVAIETTEENIIDPYEEKTLALSALLQIGFEGVERAQFNAPRGIAFAPDGSFYVADSRNHRIQHFAADGSFIGMWGEFGDATFTDLPGGIFNEPWGVAVAPDGSVYVSDTWNHRIQKFDADGNFITKWGYYGQGEMPDAFWGPRGIDVDDSGRVYVSDTGNKRIVIFDENGGFITQFGSVGMSLGEFDEQVGVAVDEAGVVYVTDTWNQRVQSFMVDDDGLTYFPLDEWEVVGWYGQSLDNKPFIAAGNGSVFITDPEGYRVIEYTPQGELVRIWGDFGYGDQNFAIAAAVAVAPDGSVWVTDAGNHRVMKFVLPE
jgi:predicted membrane-bound mannosyltransferase/DNA-binding beta-propeller fold protein YncE